MFRTVFAIGSFVVMVVACLTCGYLIGKSTDESASEVTVAENSVDKSSDNQLSPELKELLLKADTATGGKKMALATASIDGDIDVLYALDFESGNLFAWLPGRDGFLGEWTVNVAKAIGLEKGSNPDLVLTVAEFNIRTGTSGALKDVPSIVYVANGDNGQVAGFGFQWNQQLAKTGRFQRGALIPAYQGSTRQQTIKRQ